MVNGVLYARPNWEYSLESVVTPAQIGRYPTPVEMVAWTFKPDTGATESGSCSNGIARVCTRTFQRAGSLTVQAYVNGELMTSAPLRVQPPSMSLATSRDTAHVGDTIVVTTTLTGVDPSALSGYYVAYTAGTTSSTRLAAGAELAVAAAEGAAPDSQPAAVAAAPAHATGGLRSASAVPAPLPPCVGTYPAQTKCIVVLAKAGRAQIFASAMLSRNSYISAQKFVTVLAAAAPGKLVVTGPRAYGELGPAVTFTASAPGSMTLSITSWAYHASVTSASEMSTSGQLRSLVESPSAAVPCGVDATCTIIPNGAGYAVAYALVDGQPMRDSAFIQPVVTIRSVKGANDDSSFTSATGEDIIRLEAAVHDASRKSEVEWTVVSLTGSTVDTPLPDPKAANGASSEFVFPFERMDLDRWPRVHAGQAGPFQSLGYTITASLVVDGVRFSSRPRNIRQDLFDTMRQEYIDLQTPKGVPHRSDIVARSTGNQGDYPNRVISAEFDEILERYHQLWGDKNWQMNGYFRNPVHNKWHVPKGQGSGTVPGSWHQYGCAVDLQVFPVLRKGVSPPADTVKAIAFWTEKAKIAKEMGLHVEPMGSTAPGKAYSGLGHVHVNIECTP